MRHLLARLRHLLTPRGNDGLTRKERAAYADAYRAKFMRPLTEAEKAALMAWRERRL